MIHPHTLLSFHTSGSTEMFEKREQQCIEALRRRQPLTDREVMVACGFSEPNQVRPRLTKLLALGVLVEVEPVRCAITGKTVRRVRLAIKEQQTDLPLDAGQIAAIAAGIDQHRRSA